MCVCVCVCVLLFVYLPEPGLRFCSGFSLAVSRWGLLLVGGGLLIAGPSLPVQSGSRPVGFSGYGSQAPERWLDSDGAWAPC